MIWRVQDQIKIGKLSVISVFKIKKSYWLKTLLFPYYSQLYLFQYGVSLGVGFGKIFLFVYL